MSGLYVHIPFCVRKCRYCDFVSLAGNTDLIGPYLEALRADLARSLPAFGRPDTLYIGGGTPSLLSQEQLKILLSMLNAAAGPLSALKESTFEVNPESLTREKAELLRSAGITRVSVGLQASQNRLLNSLGRPASFEDFLKAFGYLRAAEFDNINVDLMTGLPGQSQSDFSEALDKVLALGPEHISLYALEVHEGTPFRKEGIREEPEAAADMFSLALPLLKAAGFEHYEISNFARKERRSLHNLNYWEQGDYLGLGAAAASHLSGKRWANTNDPRRYIETAGEPEGPALEYRETLTDEQRAAERIMLGLRKTGGIELTDDIFIEFGERIRALSDGNLLEVRGRRIKIKEEALYISNAVFREFV